MSGSEGGHGCEYVIYREHDIITLNLTPDLKYNYFENYFFNSDSKFFFLLILGHQG